MGVPKRKHPNQRRQAPEPTAAEREATEDRADVEAYDRAKAEWEADGRKTIPLEEIKREFGLK